MDGGLRKFEKASWMPVSAEVLDAWHRRSGALERLTPPWERVVVEREAGEIREGAEARLKIKLGPVWVNWVSEHVDVVPGRQFRDRQVSGPFAHWLHTHSFEDDGEGNSVLRDEVEFALPLRPTGELGGERAVLAMLERMFRYRHEVTRMDLERNDLTNQRKAMKVLVSGANGLIGQALAPVLKMNGHTVHNLTRSPTGPSDVGWDIKKGQLSLDRLREERFDGVIHLAGENIAGLRWTPEKREKIMESRRQGTRLLCERLAELDDEARPKVLVSASALGVYEPNTPEPLDESGPHGSNFMAEVVEAWEGAADPARAAGIRVAHPRMTVVLSPAGGALKMMLPVFKAGLGGKLGNGRQTMSWIAIDDLADVLHTLLSDERYEGPVNCGSPNPVTNKEFVKTLGKVLHRPVLIPVPSPAVKLALGQMGDELLLNGYNIAPAKLKENGYAFRHAELEGALRHLLGKG